MLKFLYLNIISSMYKITAFFLTIFIVAEYLEVSRCKSIPELEDNLFYKTNNKLQDVMNKLFKTFELNQNFSETKKMRLLLKMYNDFKNISENDFKSYKNVVKACKEFNNKNETTLFNLTEIIEEISRDEQFNLFDNSILKDKLNDIVTKNATFEDNNASSVFTSTIFKKIFSKINNITLKDYNHSHINSESSIIEWRRSRRKKTYLKFWRPSKTDDDIEYNMTNRRLYNGKRAEIKKYPFIVSVHVLNEFKCAGSIISKDLIITAASCLLLAYNNNNFNEDSINVRADSDYPDRDGEYCTVTDIFFHPAFDPAYLRNNLAIARMKTELYFSHTRLRFRRIEYDRALAEKPDSFHSIMMLGWGAKDEYGSTKNAEALLTTTLKNFKHISCANTYSRRYVTDKNFCAGFLDKGSGTCVRDVGGPGVVGGVLVGVVSFGPPVCGTPGAPTVFTKVSYYVNWIDSVVKKYEIVQSDAGENSNTDEKGVLTNESEQKDSSDYVFNEDYKVIQRNLPDNPKASEEIEKNIEYTTATTKVRKNRNVTRNKYATMVPEDVLQLDIDPYKATFWDKPSFIPFTDHPLYNKSFNSMADESLENIEFTITPTTSIYEGIVVTMPAIQNVENLEELKEMYKNLLERNGRGTTEMEIFNKNEESIETQVQSTRGYSAKIISHQKERPNFKDKDRFEYKVTLLVRKLKSTTYKARIHSSTSEYIEKLNNSNEFDVYSRKLEKKLKKDQRLDNTEISTKRLDYNFFFNLILNKNANKTLKTWT